MSSGAAHNYYPWTLEMFISARTLIFSLAFLYRSCEVACVYGLDECVGRLQRRLL